VEEKEKEKEKEDEEEEEEKSGENEMASCSVTSVGKENGLHFGRGNHLIEELIFYLLIDDFWNMNPCSLVEFYRNFVITSCPCRQGRRVSETNDKNAACLLVSKLNFGL
jgi:hypothetical protein